MTAGTTGRAGRGLARWFLTLGSLVGLGVGLWRVIRYSILDAGQATGSTPLVATVLLGVLTLLLLGMSARRVRDDLASYRRAHETAGAVATAALKPGALTGFAVRGLAKGSADLVDLLAPALATVMAAATVGWAVEVEGWPPYAPLAVAGVLGLACGAALAARVGAFSGRRIRPQDIEVAALPAGIVGAALLGGGAYQVAVTYGRVEAPTVAFAVLTGLVAGVLGSSASYAAKAERRKAAVRGQVAAALGVPDSALAEDAPTRWKVTRAGEVHLRPGGGAGVAMAAGDLDYLDARLAEVAPDLMVDRERSGPGVGLVLVPVTGGVRASRALLADTDGVVVGVEKLGDGTEKWTLAATVSPTQAERVDALARRRGHTLVEWRPFDREAVIGQLSEAALTLRAKLAELLRTDPWGLAIEAATDETGAITAVRVDRSPAIADPVKRRDTWLQAINAALPVNDLAMRWKYQVDCDGAGLTLTLQRDPLREVVSYAWDVEPSYKALPVGVNEDGGLVTLGLLEVNQLIGGTPGGGKSGGVTALLCGIARLKHTAIIGLDPKRVEQSGWAPRFSGIAKTPEAATAVLTAVRDEMLRRYEWLEAQGLKKVSPALLSDELPLIVVVIDELADLVSVGSTREEKAEDADRAGLIRRIIALGRAAGIVVIAATQKPQSEVVPTALRDLIQLRVAYATTNPEMTETILGKGMAQNGGLSHEIPQNMMGTAFVVNEKSRTPFRMRTYWVPDEEVAGIAERYAHLRVDLPWLEQAGDAKAPIEGQVIEVVTPTEAVVELDEVDLDDLDLGGPVEEDELASSWGI